MHKIETKGVNIVVTEAIETYVEKKLRRAFRHAENMIDHIKVNVSFESKTEAHIAEILVFLKSGQTVRNVANTDDMYASIDIACGGIERQLRKRKEKIIAVERYQSIQDKVAM